MVKGSFGIILKRDMLNLPLGVAMAGIQNIDELPKIMPEVNWTKLWDDIAEAARMSLMANSLGHTKWTCKYHIVFTPKYRRKIIYKELRADIQQIIKDLCKWKGIEIV